MDSRRKHSGSRVGEHDLTLYYKHFRFIPLSDVLVNVHN